jgi:hypothetical protein
LLPAPHASSAAQFHTSSSQLSQQLPAAPALPVAAALDLISDFRANDGCSWPKLNVAPKSSDIDLVLDSSGTILPSNIAKFLRPYQLDGVKFVYSHFARGHGCILADDMGLGKTVQTIAFLCVVLNKSGTLADEDALNLRNQESPKVLLVMPASVMYQWQSELDNWMCCSVCMFHGSAPTVTLAPRLFVPSLVFMFVDMFVCFTLCLFVIMCVCFFLYLHR